MDDHVELHSCGDLLRRDRRNISAGSPTYAELPAATTTPSSCSAEVRQRLTLRGLAHAIIAYMSKAGRQSLYRYQAHSLLDATGRCAGTPARKSAHDAELSELPCPICLGWFPLEELEEDHAPQRKNQSNLGGPHLMALTCTTCNRGAGRSYEMTVKNENDVLAQPPAPLCRVHERWGVTEVGTFVERDVAARRLVDLKSAFLIVFAALGYRWAASPRLDRIRQVLRGPTDIMFIAADYEVICGCSTAGFGPFMMYEITSPTSAILVTGAHAGILRSNRIYPSILRTLCSLLTCP